ncbi:hypothetical protein DM02DRAFT_241763 [Periconia macrospinosa]|uniref:Uncharacterized protein n=1 Tax=Periconia macrospinosa TaxID=97972 RepID=A0A2V1D5J0_9PLEO|nr:hypothetical protein DM02DRAFT_241763 [Periconia macrospinosa]
MHKLEARTPVSLSHFPINSRSPMQSLIIVVVILWITYPQPRQTKTTIHHTIRETRTAPACKDLPDLHASRITSIESEIDMGAVILMDWSDWSWIGWSKVSVGAGLSFLLELDGLD